MWNPFRARREREDHDRALERDAYLQTLATIAESFASTQQAAHEAVRELAAASKAQAEALNEHLALFKVSTAPTTHTLRDQDEYAAEMSRMGLPVDADLRDQLTFVLANSANPET